MKKTRLFLILMLIGILIQSCQTTAETNKINDQNLFILNSPSFIHLIHNKIEKQENNIFIKMSLADFSDAMNKTLKTQSAIIDYQIFLYFNDYITFETLETAVYYQSKYDIFYSEDVYKNEKKYKLKIQNFLNKIKEAKENDL